MTLAVADRVRSSYLGYPLEITDAAIVIFDPAGRLLRCERWQMSTVRGFVRDHRAADVKSEPAAQLVAERATGSNSKGA